MKTKTIIPRPQPEHLEWADCEVGVIIHLDIQVFEPTYDFREQWGYSPSPQVFNPVSLDTDQWIKSAVAAGAKYAVLTAKHCSGFCSWPTEAHAYHVGNTPWKGGQGDIVADFVASCRKYGVRPGLYYSSVCNAFLDVDNPGSVRSGLPDRQDRYNQIVEQQLTELWSRYGSLFEIWFDGGYLSPEVGGADVPGLLRRLQPNAVIFQGPEDGKVLRWVGNESGDAPYPCWSTNHFVSDSDGMNEVKDLCGNPDGQIWCPAEAAMPNRRRDQAFGNGWFWRAGEDHLVTPSAELVDCYYKTVGRNCNLLLGMAIDNRGLVPEADAAEFAGFGREISRLFATPLAAASGVGETFEIIFEKPLTLTHAVLMEDLNHGENVLSYVLEIRDGDWREIARGECIGHKRIERFPAVTGDAIRLRCLTRKETPHIRSMQLFHPEA